MSAFRYDPALKEALRRARREGISEDTEIGVAARLGGPEPHSTPVPGLRRVARFGDVITGRVRLRDIERVRAHPRVISLKAGRPLGPDLWTSGAEPAEQTPPRAPTLADTRREIRAKNTKDLGENAIVGVVDWGCDFAHESFRHADGRTRLLALWDQRGPRDTVFSPEPFGYGRVLFASDLNRALSAEDPYLAADYDPEDADLEGDGTHGTHVLDIAAGNGRGTGAAGIAPGARLLFVHLRGPDTTVAGDLGDSVRLLEAIRWMADIAGPRPLVINVSLGQHGGPHDGTSLVERGFSAFLREAPGRAIVMSTGNYFDARVHAQGQLRPGETATLEWEIFGEHGAELEVWYSGDDDLGVALFAPEGTRDASDPVLSLRLGEEAEGALGGEIVAAGYHRPRDPNNGDHHVDLFLRSGAPAGVWRVVLSANTVSDGRFHAWIERTFRGAQSRFSKEHASPCSTTGTICNGRDTIAVGAYDMALRGRPLFPFSSSGPTRDGRQKPDLCAPGRVWAARSSRRAGPRGGRVERNGITVKKGTSMAAPHVTGALARVFSAVWPSRLSIEETHEVLKESARAPPAGASCGGRAGFGRVDVAEAARIARARVGVSRVPVSKGASDMRDDDVMEFLEGCADVEIERGGEDPEACRAWLIGEDRVPQRGAAPREDRVPSRASREVFAETNGVYERKEVNSLSTAEQTRLESALRTLAARNQSARSAGQRRWGRYSDLHELLAERSSSGREIHGGSFFLPWHRWLVWRFEQQLRGIDSRITIPYWNWRDGLSVPSWVNDLGLTIRTRSGDFTPRSAFQGSAPGAHGDFTGSGGFSAFTTWLEEGWHNNVHVWVGGSSDPMAFWWSPVDFRFFLHHAQVDRVWHLWQQGQSDLGGHPLLSRTSNPLLPGFDPSDGTATAGSSASSWVGASDPHLPWGWMGRTWRLREVMDVSSMGYTYV